MSFRKRWTIIALGTSLITTYSAMGQVSSGNPIIRHIRSADPSAHVWNDGRVWIYASHDQDNATDYSTMEDYHAFSSYDLVNWTDHGELLHARNVSWGNPNGGFMFAPDAAYKNGTYYLYFPHLAADWNWRIGVATSEKPEGPFTDTGHYIEGTDHIDPACFVDDDGAAYLIWGGDSQSPKIARLKENMTALAEEPRLIEYGGGNFGEGPFMHKRNGIYYFSYTCHTCYPYQGYYAMGNNPYGPFEYKGELNLSPPGAQDHHSMIEYHGQWYYFYHVGNYGPNGSLFRRNVCIDSLFYNDDGTMQVVVQTSTGVGQDHIGMTTGAIVPGRLEGEKYFRQSGISTKTVGDTAEIVTDIHDSDWLDYVLEVLGSEAYVAEIKVSNAVSGSKIIFLVDEMVKDSVYVEENMDTLRIPLFLYKGKRTLKLHFLHSDPGIPLMDMDWIDLSGETTYYPVSASATDGGFIQPEGTLYVKEGDSIAFFIDWDLYYRPDSIMIDGVLQIPSDSYTFLNVSTNHAIRATFAPCSGALLYPYYQVNDGDSVNTTGISIDEGDDLRLLVIYDDPGQLSWLGPNGITGTGNVIDMENIQIHQGGMYSAFLTDSQGCKSKLKFDVSVEQIFLEVYQAEDWTDKSGVLNDICSDVGGGLHLGYINNGDWSTYLISVEAPGFYNAIARVATASDGGEIELGIGDRIVGTIPVNSAFSGGWQDWYTTSPVEVALEQGNHELKLTFKGGEGLLFNLNWFDLVYKRSLPVSSGDQPGEPVNVLYWYPLADRVGIGINYYLREASPVNLGIINLAGQPIRALVRSKSDSTGNHHLIWDGTNDEGTLVADGIYFLVLSSNNLREIRKVAVVK